MSTISGQYSTVPLYSLYQAGQGSSASGLSGSSSSQNSIQNNQVSNQNAQNGANTNGAQQTGSLADAQNNLAALQASFGSDADATGSASQATAPAPATYSNTSSDDSDNTDPGASFINNQEANADYQSMVLNLGMGNLAAAAKDYAQMQTDLKLHGQHHSGGTVSVDMNSGVDSAAGSVLNVTV